MAIATITNLEVERGGLRLLVCVNGRGGSFYANTADLRCRSLWSQRFVYFHNYFTQQMLTVIICGGGMMQTALPAVTMRLSASESFIWVSVVLCEAGHMGP